MNAAGIDVSKGKSTVAVMRPLGEVVRTPFEVRHTSEELGKLAKFLTDLDGETRVVMENTGSYYMPVVRVLCEAGLFVSVIHPKLIHTFSNDTIRKGKTDKKDAIKIANYCLDKWNKLHPCMPEDDTRQLLKAIRRQYGKYVDLRTVLKNNLIALTDRAFPGINSVFTSPPRVSDGHEKWVDFLADFWHCECISGMTEKKFINTYKKWCDKRGYNFSERKASDVYVESLGHVSVLPKCYTTKMLIGNAITQLNAIAETISAVANEMIMLARALPEWEIVRSMNGVGDILAAHLIAEIGDVTRFDNKGSLVAFAGLEPPPYQSGQFDSKRRHISKQGSPHLRKTLFQVMMALIQRQPDDDVYRFLDQKRSEGKHYYVYMTAASAKFLRVYYGKVKQALLSKIKTDEIVPNPAV